MLPIYGFICLVISGQKFIPDKNIILSFLLHIFLLMDQTFGISK